MGTIDQFRGDYAWLSNFYRYRMPLVLPGWQPVFPTAEHAYQACKARTGEDAAWVREAPTPQLAKSRGRQVECHPDWDQRKKAVMIKVLLAKFSDPIMRSMLLSTGTDTLIEGNTWGDDFWGAVQRGRGEIPGSMAVWAPSGLAGTDWWAGSNWLGRELMMVRDVLGDD